MSNFSNNKSAGKTTAVFKKHHVHEVAKSLTESKYIAEDYNNAHRYQHRAHVLLVGHATLRPYDPIYLDGLPNGMSGYWTVLSIKHIFGGRLANYTMRVEVGTDVIGETDPNAYKNADTRNIQEDLSGQSLTASESKLDEYSSSVNDSTLEPSYGVTPPTALTKASPLAIPSIPGTTPYRNSPPNTGVVKKTVQWVAKSNGKVVR